MRKFIFCVGLILSFVGCQMPDNSLSKLELNNGSVADEFGASNSGVESRNGAPGKDGADGKDGKNGLDGQDGQDGLDGSNGSKGKSGKDSLIETTEELAGINCPFGGYKLSVGLDTDSSGDLQEEEITSTEYVCNPDNAHNSLIVSSDEAPGSNCEFGGQEISYGVDIDDSEVLEQGEIDGSSYICSATCGSYVCGGSCGTCDVDVADTCVDGGCFCGESVACTNGQLCDTGTCVDPPTLACDGIVTNTGVAASFDYDFAKVSSSTYYDLLTTGSGSFVYYTGSLAQDFSIEQTVTLSNDSYGVKFADINDDGEVDVLTAGPNGSITSPNSVSLNTSGTFGAATTLYTSNNTAFYGSKVISADFSGDSADDAIWFAADAAYVALGAYTSAFPSNPTPINFSNAGNVYKAITADFNGDGYLDAAVALGAYSTTYNGEIAILLNNGSGVFSLVEFDTGNTSYFTGDHLNPFSIAAGDFNGDGKTDIVFPNYSAEHTEVVVGLRTSANGATPAYDFSSVWNTSAIYGVTTGDFNSDGEVDIIASTSSSAGVLEGNGDGTFALGSCTISGTLSNTKIIDIDIDGKLDLTYLQSGTIHVLYAP